MGEGGREEKLYIISFFLYLCPRQDEDMERLRKRGERFGTSVSPAIAKVRQPFWGGCMLVVSLTTVYILLGGG